MAYHKRINSAREAKKIKGIGKRTADKIGEILNTGTLRKLEEFKSNPRIVTQELFQTIWGWACVCMRVYVCVSLC